jgi:pimeloyl-ACP methyl ester carboxylesterase
MSNTTTTDEIRSADGTTIAYRRRGEGPVLILVDAAGAYHAFNSMDTLAEILADDFTVITYDRRGRGRSGDTLPYAVAREVEDIEALITGEWDEAFLFGASSGGLLVLQAAAADLPVPKLAVFEPPMGSDDVTDAEFTSNLAGLIEKDRRADAVEFFYDGIGVPPEVLAGMAPSDRDALEAVAHTLVYDCLISQATDNETLRSVHAPALVIDSLDTADEIAGWAEQVAKELRHGSAVSLPGEWHHVPDEELAPALTGFFLG